MNIDFPRNEYNTRIEVYLEAIAYNSLYYEYPYIKNMKY